MRHILKLAVAMAFIATSLHADVTVTYVTTKSSAGIMTDGRRVMYFKDTRLRIDDTAGNKLSTTILDLKDGAAVTVDHQKREASKIRLARHAGIPKSPALPAGPMVQARSNGQVREIQKELCSGFDLVVSLSDAKANVRFWTAKDAPGAGDCTAFWKAAAGMCLPIESPGEDALASAENAAVSEAFRRMAEAGGIPFQYVIEMKVSAESTGVSGGGAHASELTSRIEDISTGTIADDVFAVPSGYTNRSK